MPEQSLSDIVSALAGQAIGTQNLFDADYVEQWNEFELRVAAANPESRYLLRPLAPERMLLREFEFSCSVTVAKGRETGFALQAFPLNLNYSLRHSLKYENQSRIHMSVEQVPLAAGRQSTRRSRRMAKASELIQDLSNVPSIIGGLGLSIAAAQKAFNLDYLEALERVIAAVKMIADPKKDAAGGALAPGDISKVTAVDQSLVRDMLFALMPAKYQFSETTLVVKLDLAQSMKGSGSGALGLNYGAVSLSAAFTVGFSFDYRAAAECKTVIHAVPASENAFNALLARAAVVDDKAMTLSNPSPVDQQIYTQQQTLMEKLTGVKVATPAQPPAGPPHV